MIARPLLTLAVIPLLLALVLPAAASAGGPWVVHSVTGSKLATARTTSAIKGSIRTSNGLSAVANPSGRKGRWTAWGYVSGGDKGFSAVLIEHAAKRTPAWRLLGFSEAGPPPIIGRLVRRSGRWIVQSGQWDGSSWTTRGWANGACPPWLVGGAVYLALIARGEAW